MGVRETLNENPAITTGATAGLILVVLVYIFWSTFSGNTAATNAVANAQIYYSIDDGATFVADSMATQHTDLQIDGKPAVVAHVYSCDGNKTKFVGYLERFTPAARKAMKEQADALNAGKLPDFAAADSVAMTGREVKRPKEARWVNGSSAEGIAVTQVKCPNGAADAVEVTPEP